MTKANFGVVGMAVMGRNLALNIESRGYTVAIYNRSKEKTEDVIACHPEKNFVPSYDVESFVNSIEKPSSYHADGSSWTWYRCYYPSPSSTP
ncbi:choline binding protein J [Streptococcus pneumoniae]|nr:choline binding protein J [Streptococcus pneumoniae]